MNSENLLFIDDAHFRLKISELFAPEGSEKVIFKKSLKSMLDGYLNIIYVNFQISNPVEFGI